MSTSFNAATTFPIGQNPASLAVTDLNKDGILDILTGGTTTTFVGFFPVTQGTFSVLLGTGNGQFGSAIVTSNAQFGSASQIAVGDFNGDSNPDVISLGSLSSSASNLFLSLGDGKGGFTPAKSLILGGTPQSVAVGNIDGDGFLDAAVAEGDSSISLLLGNGKGDFKSITGIAIDGNASDVALQDFNGDQRLDLAVVATIGQGSDQTTQFVVLQGDGQGGFTPQEPVDLELPSYSGADLAIADLNGDGRLDAVISTNNQISVLLSDPTSAFQLVFQTQTQTQLSINEITTGDFNGDGRIDIATSLVAYGSNGTTVMLGNGKGYFSRPLTFLPQGNFGSSIGAGDLNKDGKLDLVSTNPLFKEVAVSINTTTAKDAIAQSSRFDVGYIDASSEESGPVTIDLTKGTFVLEGPTRITRSVRNVDEAIGTIFNDSITGNKRNNFLNGFSGRDQLLGEDGDDRLVGGASNDQLEGGDGKDRFIFTTTPNYPEGLNEPFRKVLLGIDRILDFERGKDKIVLDQGTFTEVEKKVKFDTVDTIREARTSSGIITYIRDSGKLFYNANGSRAGFGEGGQFAVLEGDINLGRKDFSVFL